LNIIHRSLLVEIARLLRILLVYFLFFYIVMSLNITNLVILGLSSILIVRLTSRTSRIRHNIQINIITITKLSNINHLVKVPTVVHVDELLIAILSIYCNLIRRNLIRNVLDIVLSYYINVSTNTL